MLAELLLLQQEVETVLPLTAALWKQHPRHFPYTSYGYAMCLFSKVDLLSQYWLPSITAQTDRMTEFLVQCVGRGVQESTVAVKLWRHCLMHTSQPRPLIDHSTGRTYRWLLQHELTGRDHFTLVPNGNDTIFNMGLLNLCRDLRASLEALLADLPNRADIMETWPSVSARIARF